MDADSKGEELFQCPICFETFNEKFPAKILKFCGHFFCLKCLEQLYSKTAFKGMIKCPLCNYRTVFLTHGFFGRKKVPKVEELRKILPDCRVLRLLVKHQPTFSQSSANLVKYLQMDVLPKLTVCKICKNRFENPRMMPYCQHSYCLSCIEKLYKNQNQGFGSILCCPTCQNRIAFVSSKSAKNKGPPSASVIGTLLPVDYALSTLMTVFT